MSCENIPPSLRCGRAKMLPCSLTLAAGAINLKRSDKYDALSNLSIYHTQKNIKKSYKNSKFKISAPTSNEEFELPDGSNSVPDIQDYVEYILKKHGEKTENPLIRMCVNKIENIIIFKIKTGYYLELLTTETLKLLGSTENKITKNRNSENVPHLKITEVVLIHCNIVNNNYQQDSRVLYTFVFNKSFGQLLDISPKHLIQNFNILKYGLLIKIINRYRQKIKQRLLQLLIKV